MPKAYAVCWELVSLNAAKGVRRRNFDIAKPKFSGNRIQSEVTDHFEGLGLHSADWAGTGFSLFPKTGAVIFKDFLNEQLTAKDQSVGKVTHS